MVTDLKMAYSEKSLKAEIQPCPFCGSVNNLVITDDDTFYDLYHENGSATLSIECRKCYVEMYEHDYVGNDYDHKAKILIEKWNRRKAAK